MTYKWWVQPVVSTHLLDEALAVLAVTEHDRQIAQRERDQFQMELMRKHEQLVIRVTKIKTELAEAHEEIERLEKEKT